MYNEMMAEILSAFGLTRKSKLPVEGRDARVVNLGLTERFFKYGEWIVWIDPVPPEGKKSRFTHRVKARCLKCSQVLSAGRIHQHVCKH